MSVAYRSTPARLANELYIAFRPAWLCDVCGEAIAKEGRCGFRQDAEPHKSAPLSTWHVHCVPEAGWHVEDLATLAGRLEAAFRTGAKLKPSAPTQRSKAKAAVLSTKSEVGTSPSQSSSLPTPQRPSPPRSSSKPKPAIQAPAPAPAPIPDPKEVPPYSLEPEPAPSHCMYRLRGGEQCPNPAHGDKLWCSSHIARLERTLEETAHVH